LIQFLEVLAWVATNGQTETTLQSYGWAPLSIAYKKRLIDLLGQIHCQDAQALTVAYVVGTGGPLSAFYDWAQEYSTSSYQQKYFDSTTASAIVNMRYGTHPYRSLRSSSVANRSAHRSPLPPNTRRC
jgi:hypothetical protein